MRAFPRSGPGRHATRLTALALVVLAYGFTRLPRLPDDERAALAARFDFTEVVLPGASALEGAGEPASIRNVHPSLSRIDAWISSVGAAVALADLDGDGLADDACSVDVRTDQVVVEALPTSPAAYPSFALETTPLPYDPSTAAPMGCLPGDLNEDGQTDLLVYYWGRTPVAFLRTGDPRGPPTADRYHPVEVSDSGERWYTNAATRADLDGDGHADLVIGNYFPDGAWVLGADRPGRESMQHSMSRAFNGGRSRILRWTGATAGRRDGTPPTVRFQEVDALDERVAHGWALAVGAADLDDDLLPEIYFANDFGPDRLLHNRSRPGEIRFARLEGERRLATARSKILGRDSFKGMGVDFADLNGDGLLDIYVSNIAAKWSLEESHFLFESTGRPSDMADGRAPYVDRSEPLGLSRSGWGWDTRFGDFDNDGSLEALQATGFLKGEQDRWPELHELAMGNDELVPNTGSWPRFGPGDDLSGHQHNPFFVRSSSGRFFDLAPDLGLDRPHVTRGIATADVDGDGDLDFVIANQWEDHVLHVNEAPDPGRFLGLHLLLPLQPTATRIRPGHPGPDTPGRAALHATVRVRHPDGTIRVDQVDGGNGHSGVGSPELHFGLGRGLGRDLERGPGSAAGPVNVDVEIAWRSPDGTPRRETLRLSPGWHTVLLGWEGDRPTR